jgi:bacterial/archaeal transporter family-2 protein
VAEILTYLLAIAGGASSGLQSTINGRLGTLTAPLNAAVISTVVGLVSLLGVAALTRQLSVHDVARVPPILLLGGIFGAIFVTSVIVAVPRLGVVTTITLAVLGQLVAAALVDHLGLLGNPRIELGLGRVAGIALVVVGFVLARSR